MNKLLRLLLTLSCATLWPCSAFSKNVELGNYHALLIANSEYSTWNKLKTPQHDIDAIGKILQKEYGFAITKLRNVSSADIIDELEKLKKTLTSHDSLLIYYAGHGTLREKEQQGFWIGINAKTDSKGDWLSYQEISSLIDTRAGMQAKHVFVIADSCYSGAILRDKSTTKHPDFNSINQSYLIDRNQNTSRSVLTAGGISPVIDSIENSKHSMFANRLIEELSGKNTLFSSENLYNNIYLDIHERSKRANNKQTPEYGRISGTGDRSGLFVFKPQNIHLNISNNPLPLNQEISIRGGSDSSSSQTSSNAPPIVGCWSWSNGSAVKFSNNNLSQVANIQGNWRKQGIDSYEVDWDKITDTVNLQTEGLSLGGSNNYGFPILYTRISGSANNIVGTWQSMDKATTIILEKNGSAIFNHIAQGRWKKTDNGTFEVHWEIRLLDKLAMVNSSHIVGETFLKVVKGVNGSTPEFRIGTLHANRAANCNLF